MSIEDDYYLSDEYKDWCDWLDWWIEVLSDV